MKKHSYKFPRPALTVDLVVFGYFKSTLSVLLIRRGLQPFRGKWALPGGFVRENERLEEAARRELQEETGLKCHYLEQLYTFDDPLRDPRERVISVAYYGIVRSDIQIVQPSTDADEAEWFPIHKLPLLAFDHQTIVEKAFHRLKNKIRYEAIGFILLAREFTLTELQALHETILGEGFDKRNFRKKMLSSGILVNTKKKTQGLPFRSPQLFRVNTKKFHKTGRKGSSLKI